MKTYPTVLSIAGSDPSGGAGIQADIKSCSTLGVYAMTVITALTAQSTTGVTRVAPCDPAMLRAQLWTLLEDVRPDAVKIGMVPDGPAMEIIAEALRTFRLTQVVVDPLMVSTSGHSLSNGESLHILKEALIPQATLLTPNLPEAKVLSGIEATQVDEMQLLAARMSQDYGIAVLLKGGHLADTSLLTDVLATPDGNTIEFTHPMIETPNTHGTGCSLSSAIAAQLALGNSLTEAVRKADDWMHLALEAGADYRLGRGHGPINHLFNIINHANNSQL